MPLLKGLNISLNNNAQDTRPKTILSIAELALLHSLSAAQKSTTNKATEVMKLRGNAFVKRIKYFAE
jgi:hypothetical protein